MAKRVRTSSKSVRRTRPTRPASERPNRDAAAPARSPVPPPTQPTDDLEEMPLRSSGHLTESEIARAAALEAEVEAQERAAIAEALRRRSRGRAADPRAGLDVNAPLSVRAASEYAYVARDVRRIALTAGLTGGILVVLHVLVNVMGVITI